MRLFVSILLAVLAFSAAPLRAQSSADPGDLFVTAYMAVQQGEKAEQAGDFKGALNKLRSAASVLDQIATRYPSWQPQIVEYRKTRTADGIARVQEKIARFGGGKSDAPVGLPTEPPPLPTADGSEPPPLQFPTGPTGGTAGPHKTTPRKGAAPSNESNLFEQAAARMKKLEEDLKSAKDEAIHLQTEKTDLAHKLEESAHAMEASNQKQQTLQKRADIAEQALMKAMSEGKTDSEKIKALQADAAATKRALRDMRIEAEADTEYRKQIDDRYHYALSRIQQLTQQRDTAAQTGTTAPGKIEGIEKQLEQVKKEKDELAVKLQKAETQLSKVTTERDDALAQVAKLQDAQKQVDKLVSDNAALMAKLSDAQKTINQFKMEGEEKDMQIAALKKEVGSVKEQLAEARKESADYQRQMADLQTKLELSGKQLAAAKAENAASAAEKKKMVEENAILRGIVLREQKEEAIRAKTKKVVLGELQDLDVHSKSLLQQINLLGEPVVKLTEKERALFKKPELQVSDTEIAIGVVADQKPADEPPPAPAVDAKPSAPAAVEPPTAAPSKPAAIALATPIPAPVVEIKSTPAPVTSSKSKTSDSSKTAATKKTDTPKPEAKSITLDQPPLPAPENLAPISRQDSTSPVPPMPANPPAIGSRSPEKPLSEAQANPATEPPADPSAAAVASANSAAAAGNAINVPQDLLPLAREGKDQFERGNYLEAEKIYRKILAKAPNNLYTLSNLGVVLFRAKKHKLAEEAFKKAIAVAPEDSFSHCTLGIVYYDQAKYDDAVNELTRTLAIEPKNATAHNYLGITASQKGWQEAAQKELETATSLEPGYADAWFNLAVIYATQTPPNKELARKCYNRAVELGAERDAALELLIK